MKYSVIQSAYYGLSSKLPTRPCSLFVFYRAVWPVFWRSSAQTDVWQRTVTRTVTGLDNTYDMIRTSDGNYLAVGTSRKSTIGSNPTIAMVIKYDPAGNILWSRDIGTNTKYPLGHSSAGGNMDTQGQVVREDPFGNYIVGGRTEDNAMKGGIFITRLNASTGAEMFTFQHGSSVDAITTTFEDLRGLTADATGIYFCGEGPYDYPDGRLSSVLGKIDYSGNLLWRKAYLMTADFGLIIRFASLDVNPVDNSLIISAATSRLSGSGVYQPILMKVDRDGVLQWAKEYNPPASFSGSFGAPHTWNIIDAIVRPDGNIIGVGTYRYNPTGTGNSLSLSLTKTATLCQPSAWRFQGTPTPPSTARFKKHPTGAICSKAWSVVVLRIPSRRCLSLTHK